LKPNDKSYVEEVNIAFHSSVIFLDVLLGNLEALKVKMGDFEDKT